MVSFMLHWSVTLLFLFAVGESVSVGTADKPDKTTAQGTALAEDGAKAHDDASADSADTDENGDVRAPLDDPGKPNPTDSQIKEIISTDERAEEEAAKPSSAGQKASTELAARKDQDPGGEALKACEHLIPKEIQHVNLYAGSPAETAEGDQHETVTDSQQAGGKTVFGDLARCVTHVAALGRDLQEKLTKERNLNVGYAEQYTKVLESLEHLQGPAMEAAFHEDTKNAKADYNHQLDGIDAQLKVFKVYTNYGSSAQRAHQKGLNRKEDAHLEAVDSQGDQAAEAQEDDRAAGRQEERVQSSGTNEIVDKGFSSVVPTM